MGKGKKYEQKSAAAAVLLWLSDVVQGKHLKRHLLSNSHSQPSLPSADPYGHK
jgi:hypothetical protein